MAALAWSLYAAHAVLVMFVAAKSVWALSLPQLLAGGVGVALIAFGILLYGAGAAVMRSLARMSGRRADRLITSGAYRFIRHPQLVGWALVLLGVAVWGRSLLALLLVVLYLIGLSLLVPTEESKLEQVFGQEYRDYKRQTPPYLGWPKE